MDGFATHWGPYEVNHNGGATQCIKFLPSKPLGIDGWVIELFTRFWDLLETVLLAMVGESKSTI
jgi:hypothetical protein